MLTCMWAYVDPNVSEEAKERARDFFENKNAL